MTFLDSSHYPRVFFLQFASHHLQLKLFLCYYNPLSELCLLLMFDPLNCDDFIKLVEKLNWLDNVNLHVSINLIEPLNSFESFRWLLKLNCFDEEKHSDLQKMIEWLYLLVCELLRKTHEVTWGKPFWCLEFIWKSHLLWPCVFFCLFIWLLELNNNVTG